MAEVASLQDAADRSGLILASASLHKAVEMAERRFRSIFEDAPVGVAMVELTDDGRFVDVNDQYCRLTGYGRDELLAMSPLDLVHPPDRPRAAEVALGLLTGAGDHFRQEVSYVRADGEVIKVRLSASATTLGAGRRDAVVSVEDVTERARAAEALAMSEERFRATFEHSPAGLAVVSLGPEDEGHILRANSRLCDLMGCDPVEDHVNMYRLDH